MKIIKILGLGGMISLSVYCLLGLPFVDAEVRNNLISVFCLGIVLAALSLVYDTNLPLLFASAIHLGGSLSAFLLIAYWLRWFPFSPSIVIGAIGSFFVVFMIIWNIYYWSERYKIEQFNQKRK